MYLKCRIILKFVIQEKNIELKQTVIKQKTANIFNKVIEMLIQILLILIGFTLLIKGADFLVDGSSAIAKKLHISEIIIGLTIVSIGTSMPELFVSTTSALQGSSDISIGNIIGSNICNLLFILGLSSIIRPVKFQKQTKWIENPMSIILTFIFFIICTTNQYISRFEGIILIGLFILFLIYTIIMAKRNQQDVIIQFSTEETQKISIIKNAILVILGIIILKFGGELVVENAKRIAIALNISEKVIGLTIVAIGTSLPELVTSITAAIKNESDIAIGNIVGSNIFNMLLIIGTSAIIKPITYNVTYNSQMAILFIGMIMITIFPFIKPKDTLSRLEGLACVFLYIFYTIKLFF